MLEINMSVEVGSAADVVWKIVGNFNGMPDWHPTFYEAAFNHLPVLFGA